MGGREGGEREGGRETRRKEGSEGERRFCVVCSILRINSDDCKACGTVHAQPISVFIFLFTLAAVFTTGDFTGLRVVTLFVTLRIYARAFHPADLVNSSIWGYTKAVHV